MPKSDPPAATLELSENERSYLYSIAMKYVKDEDAAADVAQDALLLAYRHRASFRGEARYSTWLYRIAATTALMHLRKQRRRAREISVTYRPGEPDNDAVLERPSPASNPEQQASAREAMRAVEARLVELGDKYGDIFRLRFYEGYTETEIAERLGLNVATVKTRAYRARQAVLATLDAALYRPRAA